MSQIAAGVIGLRGMGSGHVREMTKRADVNLVAVADINADLAGDISDQHGAVAYTDYRRMLEMEALDAVIIATPHALHASMALDSLVAGCHVLVEKPIAMRVSDADRMIKSADEQNLVLAVGHNYRSYPVNLMLKNLIDEDKIGALYRVHWQWLENRPDSYYHRDPWRCTWRQAGGGVLMNQTSHDLDLMCWLFGKPVEVSAMMANYGHQHEVEDTAIATVRFESGAYATIQLSTCSSCLNFRHIWGEKGEIVMRDTRNANVHIPEYFRLGQYEDTLKETIRSNPEITGQPVLSWQDIECRDQSAPTLLDSFLDAVQGEGIPVTDGKSALQTLELINAIILSAIRKKTVRCPVDRDEYDTLFNELCEGSIKI